MLWNSVCAPAAAAPEIFVKFLQLHKKTFPYVPLGTENVRGLHWVGG